MKNKKVNLSLVNGRTGYLLGYEQGIKETQKAFGGCLKCYGKGYGTQTLIEESYKDFGNEKTWRHKVPTMVFCKCSRGKQLEKLLK